MTINNLEEYIEWTDTTAVYPKGDNDYIYIGLVEEVGECLGQYKRVIRDDGGEITSKRRESILTEIGDCSWYLARIARENDIHHLIQSLHIDNSYTSLQNLVRIAAYLYTYTPRERDMTVSMVSCAFGCIDEIAKSLNSSIDEVIEMNYKKLSSRKERGVIHGSGDNR